MTLVIEILCTLSSLRQQEGTFSWWKKGVELFLQQMSTANMIFTLSEVEWVNTVILRILKVDLYSKNGRKKPPLSVKDCKVSEWGPWSPCSATECGEFGSEERHRVVLHQPVNGGAQCPHLVQSRQCVSNQCDETHYNFTSSPQHQAPTLKPIKHKYIRTMTPKKVVRTSFVSRSNGHFGCMELVVIKASAGCHHHDQRLHIGEFIKLKMHLLLAYFAEVIKTA